MEKYIDIMPEFIKEHLSIKGVSYDEDDYLIYKEIKIPINYYLTNDNNIEIYLEEFIESDNNLFYEYQVPFFPNNEDFHAQFTCSSEEELIEAIKTMELYITTNLTKTIELAEIYNKIINDLSTKDLSEDDIIYLGNILTSL